MTFLLVNLNPQLGTLAGGTAGVASLLCFLSFFFYGAFAGVSFLLSNRSAYALHYNDD
jgi:hypothetical protein